MATFRRYRLLLIVIGLVSISLYRELTSNQRRAARSSTAISSSNPGYASPSADPESAQEKAVLTELYPDSTDTLFSIAVDEMAHDHPVQARAAFERALGTGIKSNEDLLFVYSLFLIRTHAPQAEIDAAVNRWKYNFPYSTLPDPRAIRNVGSSRRS